MSTCESRQCAKSGVKHHHQEGRRQPFQPGWRPEDRSLDEGAPPASPPFDLRVVESGDLGKPLLEAPGNSPFIQAFKGLVDEVEERLRHPQGASQKNQ